MSRVQVARLVYRSQAPRRFTCLRVIDVAAEPAEDQTLVEAFLEAGGRTVLFRRYNGRAWRAEQEDQSWDQRFPEHARLVVDGATFVHWYDCLTDMACGISEGAAP